MTLAILVLLQFVAGFAATLLFHQPLMAIFKRAGISPRPAYDMTPAPPLGVPSVISLAFWGGLWGIVMLHALHRFHDDGAMWWIAVAIFSALLPTLVAGLVVVPLKKIKVTNRGQMFLVGLTVNAAWGLGTALLYVLMSRFVAR